MTFLRFSSTLLLLWFAERVLSTDSSVRRGRVFSETTRQLQQPAHCGCFDCTETIWNTDAVAANGDSHTCGERISWVRDTLGGTEEDACRLVAGTEFPTVCGAGCDPDRCDDDAPAHCGCYDCTEDIWNSDAGGHTCGARITWVRDVLGNTEDYACRLVAGTEFPTICGAGCDPDRCITTPSTQPPTTFPTEPPTTSPTEPPAAAPTEQPTTPPTQPPTTSPTEPPTTPRTESPTTPPTSSPTALPSASLQDESQEPLHCGCFDCTEEIWGRDASGYTCGARITWVRDQLGNTEDYACRLLAGTEFPTICGAGCDPNRCDGRTPSTESPLAAPGPSTFDAPLYCFPDYADRIRWTGAWGNYIVEVKEDPNGGLCGPSFNNFAPETVSLDTSTGELKLEFKKVNGKWSASEVRVVMPEAQMPYSYGTYYFNVKSVGVYNETSKVSDVLPPSMVLGLFTWDPTDNYAIRENYSREVDVEITRLNDPNNQDAQFLVQPPELPQYKRFFSGGADGEFDQNGNSWEFTWHPGVVSWYTTAGGGIAHSYSTEEAVSSGLPDRVQCLPADVEVRLNLWNLGGINTPMEMAENERVEVVVDDFVYTLSGLTGVADGGSCTKDCQCESTSICVNGVCEQGQRSTTKPAACSAYPACAHLANDCCPPSPGGTDLYCCNE